MMPSRLRVCLLALLLPLATALADQKVSGAAMPVEWQWGLRIPLRDGVRLNATLYRPRGLSGALPCLFALTPYTAQGEHQEASYFAAHGYVALAVDSRGRGESEGEFFPYAREAADGHDIVEWLAQQSWCNGKVGMWGGSYLGMSQWATAGSRAPHLATIVPAVPSYAGVDYPAMVNNIPYLYRISWLTLVTGRALQIQPFIDKELWSGVFREHVTNHRPFAELDRSAGNASLIFREHVAHPHPDAYWDAQNPGAADLAALDMPILSITGQYDVAQSGTLAFYRRHLENAAPAARARHFLVIGPWTHSLDSSRGEVAGLPVGKASDIDLKALHGEWYDWTLKQGPRPQFLQNRFAYYVTGTDVWRYADSLEAATRGTRSLYLVSQAGRASDVFHSGRLQIEPPGAAAPPDSYVYDPLDTSAIDLQGAVIPEPLIDKRELTSQSEALLSTGRALFYHGAPYTQDTEVSGFFRLDAWIAIDQPDTDFFAKVYEIRPDGSSVFLTGTVMRARYRESLREPKRVTPGKPLEYRFDFPFVARRVAKGSRLRLVFAPVNSIHLQRNYNSGGVVAQESARDARTVTVQLLHDAQHRSVLHVPLGATG